MKTYLDTETCGFHGMPVLLQYAYDDGPINLHEFWRTPVLESMQLIEQIAQTDVVGFNLVFDWFHLCKIYTTFLLCDPDWIPEEHITEIALLEKEARMGPCLKPVRALDLMLIAKKGRYQSLMDRKPIKIKKVPEALAHKLCDYVEQHVALDDIYFSRQKNKHAPRWRMTRCEDKPGFFDVKLQFKASGALKVLAQHALKRTDILKHSDIEIDKKYRPKESGWAPFALAIGKPGKWNWSWPDVIQFHIDHWAYNQLARKYGTDDVDYTRDLDPYFGNPEPGDKNSTLACQVAATRWHGFALDIDKIKAERIKLRERIRDVPLSPRPARYYITEVMDPIEAMQVKSTGRKKLEAIAKLECDCCFDPEIKCDCGGTKRSPAARRAKEVLEARQDVHKDKIFQKLLQAGRFHASYKVTGTLSDRMSGADKLNPQGFERGKDMRACFTLADPGEILGGGDFDSFEVTIADAEYDDPELRKALQVKVPCLCLKDGKPKPGCDDCRGTGMTTQKVHGLYGMELSGLTYDQVVMTKGDPSRDWYNTGKAGFLSQMYGGTYHSLMDKQGLEEEVAKAGFESFNDKYHGVAKAREKIIDMFCSMRQPGGIGTKVEWHEPAEKIESKLGHPRYFTLENNLCRTLFDLANNLPKEWTDIKIKVVRNDRRQFVGGAVRSALYGAAFQIQAQAMRAAANHVIQSTGAEITKDLQCRIWAIQPAGVHPWRVRPMNAHDEVMVASLPEYAEEVKRVADETVQSYRDLIPLIDMYWKVGMKSWAEK